MRAGIRLIEIFFLIFSENWILCRKCLVNFNFFDHHDRAYTQTVESLYNWSFKFQFQVSLLQIFKKWINIFRIKLMKKTILVSSVFVIKINIWVEYLFKILITVFVLHFSLYSTFFIDIYSSFSMLKMILKAVSVCSFVIDKTCIISW